MWLLGDAMDMGVGCDCFLLLDCNLAAAATGVEVDKEDDDDFRDRFRLLFGVVIGFRLEICAKFEAGAGFMAVVIAFTIVKSTILL